LFSKQCSFADFTITSLAMAPRPWLICLWWIHIEDFKNVSALPYLLYLENQEMLNWFPLHLLVLNFAKMWTPFQFMLNWNRNITHFVWRPEVLKIFIFISG
jgi:hypothetical protein